MAEMWEMLQQIEELQRPPGPAAPPPSQALAAERKGALGEYMGAIRTSGRQPDDIWQAAGLAVLSSPSGRPSDVWGSVGQGLAAHVKDQRDEEWKREVMATKAKYDDVAKRMDSTTRFGRGTTGFEFRRNSDGTTTAYSKATGMPTGTYGPEDISKITNMAQTLAKAAFERGEFESLDEALAWASTRALEQVSTAQAAVGNRTAPLQGNVGGVPTAPASAQPPTAATGVAAPSWPPSSAEKGAAPVDDAQAVAGSLDTLDKEAKRYGNIPDAAAEIEVDRKRVMERFSALPPDQQERVRNLLKGAMTVGQGAGATARVAAAENVLGAPLVQKAPDLPKKNVQAEEFKKAYGGEEGKTYARKYEDIVQTGQAANTLEGKLNLMEQLTVQHGDNIPEGKAGPLIADLKSTMKSFGIALKGTGVSDVITSLGTEGALKSKTADGENLLPGAMSNYEDQLLQKIFPSLGFTKDGRLLQIQIAKAQLEMRKNLAAAAREYRKNTGRLDAGWDDVAEAYAKANPFLNERRIRALEAYAAQLAKGPQ